MILGVESYVDCQTVRCDIRLVCLQCGWFFGHGFQMGRLCQLCFAFSVSRFPASAMRLGAFSEVDRMLSPSLQPFIPLFSSSSKNVLPNPICWAEHYYSE